MKSTYIIILVGLLMIGSFSCFADDSDEEITRALIVVRLLSQIEWQESEIVNKNVATFKLCFYDDILKMKIFQKHLRQVLIRKRPIETKNIKRNGLTTGCNAFYLLSPEDKILTQLIQSSNQNRTIIVVEGSGYDDKKVHFNLYLNNEGFFDFVLNPSAFVATKHIITPELLALGRIKKELVEQKTNLLRFLINYTQWPEEDTLFAKSKTIQICSCATNSFAFFVAYFMNNKRLKGRQAVFKRISNYQELENCQVLILKAAESGLVDWVMPRRQTLGMLLIGDSSGLGEQGVHYNLSSVHSPHGKRFEINLSAFKLTEHIPNYQLLNSALVINKGDTGSKAHD